MTKSTMSDEENVVSDFILPFMFIFLLGGLLVIGMVISDMTPHENNKQVKVDNDKN